MRIKKKKKKKSYIMSDLANHFALSPFSLIVVGYHLRCVMEWHGTEWSSWTGSFDVGDDADDGDDDDDAERDYKTNVYHFLPTLPNRPSISYATLSDDGHGLINANQLHQLSTSLDTMDHGVFLFWSTEFNDDGWTKQQSINQHNDHAF